MRRRFLLPALLIFFAPFVLEACAQTGTQTAYQRAILAAQGAVDMLAGTGNAVPPGLIRAVAAADPALFPATSIPEIMAKLDAANRLLGTLNATTAPAEGADTLRQVEGYINSALLLLGTAAQTSPALAKYALLINAVAIGSQIVEAYVNQQMPTARLAGGPVLSRMRSIAIERGMTPEKALVTLEAGK